MERRRAIRAAVSEDHEIFRRELLVAIEAEGLISVSEEVVSLSHLRFETTAPIGVVVVDLSSPDDDPIAAMVHLSVERPEVSLIALAGPLDDPLPALLAGAIGVVDKATAVDDIADAIRISAEKGAFFSRTAARAFVRVGAEVLEPEAIELLQHRAAGRTHAEIAEFLGIERLELGHRMRALAAELRSRRSLAEMPPRVAETSSVE